MEITKYLSLPSEITSFEDRFVRRLNKIALAFFWLHVPILMAVAWAAHTGPSLALLLSLVVLAGPTLGYRAIRNPRWLSVVYGVTAMLMGGLLVHFGQGPVQIEMHFYFFAMLAMLCMFANPAVNLAAAGTVALHHLLVWWLLPSSVFNYDAQWWVVLVHAGFVVLETVAACFISRQFFDNVIGLEKIVEARTETIRLQQRDMRLILNNLQEGLVTIDLDGKMSSETSQVVNEWFGNAPDDGKFVSWIGRRDSNFAEWLDLGLEGLRDMMLPAEVAVGQLPATLKDSDKTYSVRYQLIMNARESHEQLEGDSATAADQDSAGSPEKILVIITDVTELLNKEAETRHQAELLQLFQHSVRDKAGFLEFLAEADEVVKAVKSGPRESLDQMKRLVHTLKGNCAIFGMRLVPQICHEIENRIVEVEEYPSDEELEQLEQAWTRIRSDIRSFLPEPRVTSIEIDEAEFENSLKALRNGVDAKAVAKVIDSWRLEPAEKRLERIATQIVDIGRRLGKDNIQVATETHDLRLSSDHFAPFWAAFVHVLRNTVDHGVDDRADRLRLDKPETSSIKLTAAIENQRFVIRVEDDGPGVDWERLRERAMEIGIPPAEFERNPENLLFMPGVSSRSDVTEVSGRGMGLSAVRDACTALGGTIQVKSTRGSGTVICFSFPKDQGVYEVDEAALLAGVA